MIPIYLYSHWNQRPSDSNTPVEPLRKYFFLSEGANTERFYFEKLIDIKKDIGISNLIELVFIEKTGQDKDISFPKNLINFAKVKREELINKELFNPDRDIMIVVFNLDIFKGKDDHLKELIKQQSDNLIFGITYLSFELFLLLHLDQSLNNYILPNQEAILENKKIDKKRPCEHLLWELTGINSKKNQTIGDLAAHIETAVNQEKYINQEFDNCLTTLTSNIGAIIETIKKDCLPY